MDNHCTDQAFSVHATCSCMAHACRVQHGAPHVSPSKPAALYCRHVTTAIESNQDQQGQASGTALPLTSMQAHDSHATELHAQPALAPTVGTGMAACLSPSVNMPSSKRQKTTDGALAALGRALLSPVSTSALPPPHPPTLPTSFNMQPLQAVPLVLFPPGMQGMTPAAALASLTQLLSQQQAPAPHSIPPHTPRDPRLTPIAAADRSPSAAAALMPQHSVQQQQMQHGVNWQQQQQLAQQKWHRHAQGLGAFGFKLHVPAQGCLASLEVPPAVARLLKPEDGSKSAGTQHLTVIDQAGKIELHCQGAVAHYRVLIRYVGEKVWQPMAAWQHTSSSNEHMRLLLALSSIRHAPPSAFWGTSLRF